MLQLCQSKRLSGNIDGVPSPENPNGSNAACPPKPLPRKVPVFPAPILPPSAGVAVPELVKLRTGLKERFSRFESGKAKERSGGGLGAGAVRGVYEGRPRDEADETPSAGEVDCG